MRQYDYYSPSIRAFVICILPDLTLVLLLFCERERARFLSFVVMPVLRRHTSFPSYVALSTLRYRIHLFHTLRVLEVLAESERVREKKFSGFFKIFKRYKYPKGI